MKLRLHGDTLRLRLSQSDTNRLLATGWVEEALSFPPNSKFYYRLETGDAHGVDARFDGEGIRVVVPLALAKSWIESDRVGVEGISGPLRLLIEKDFQCLHRNSLEDRDSFPNPLVQKG